MTGGTGPYAIAQQQLRRLRHGRHRLITASVDLSSLSAPVARFNSTIDLGSTSRRRHHRTAGRTGPTSSRSGAATAARGTFRSTCGGRRRHVKARSTSTRFFGWWWQVDNVLVGDRPAASPRRAAWWSATSETGTTDGPERRDGREPGRWRLTKTFATPGDDSARRLLHPVPGERPPDDLEASLTNYASDQHSKLVVPEPARGRISSCIGPRRGDSDGAQRPGEPGRHRRQTMTLTNSGGAPANFEILEINAPLLTTSNTHGFANKAVRRQALARFCRRAPRPSGADCRHARARGAAAPRLTGTAAGGRATSSRSIRRHHLRVGRRGERSRLLALNIGVAGGDDKDYPYDSGRLRRPATPIDDVAASATGRPTAPSTPTTGSSGRSTSTATTASSRSTRSASVNGQHDLRSPWTGTLSAVSPTTRPTTPSSSAAGTRASSTTSTRPVTSSTRPAAVSPISGLAYAASSGHLLVMENSDRRRRDGSGCAEQLRRARQLPVMDGGSPVLGDFEQAGIEFDCIGNLWAVNQNTQTVYKIDPARAPAARSTSRGSRWTRRKARSPRRLHGRTSPVTVDCVHGGCSGSASGPAQGQDRHAGDRCRRSRSLLTVRFIDVPDDNQFQAFIYGVGGAGVMFGGPPVCRRRPQLLPGWHVTRADMAGYLCRAAHGRTRRRRSTRTSSTTSRFNDYNSFYIQGIFDHGITAGCARPAIYCPTSR